MRPNLDARDYQIIQLWNEFKNVAKVSYRCGLSRGGVYRILDKHNIVRPHPKRGGRAKGYIPPRKYLKPKTNPIKWDRPLTCLDNGKDKLLDRLYLKHATDEMREARA